MSQKNYKDTLNLPRTDFPMKANLTAREPELLKAWQETRLYQQIQKARQDRQLFVLHDGPPFANGDVHMGTALNKILKDFVLNPDNPEPRLPIGRSSRPERFCCLRVRSRLPSRAS
jgi:isoleucyl-tRNA synthetase